MNTPPDPPATAAPPPADDNDALSDAAAALAPIVDIAPAAAPAVPPVAPPAPAPAAADKKEKPSYHGHRQRLRQRFMQSEDFSGFGQYEIMELLLTLAIPRADVKQPAKDILAKFKTLRAALDASPEDLQKIKGLGSVTPVALKIIRAAAQLYLRQQSATERVSLSGGDALRRFWRMQIGGKKHEVFAVAYLNTDHTLYSKPDDAMDGYQIISEGDIDRTTVYIKKILEGALLRGVRQIVLAHNHPSGNTTPSGADLRLTQRIVTAAAAVEMEIVDHYIVYTDSVYSFREAGHL